MSEKRDTIGKISSELLTKDSPTNSPIELEREMHTEYDANLLQCVQSSKSNYPSDFYVVVITKRERLMPNVFRNYFFARQTCPTPEWDQAVYRYRRSSDGIDFMWVIPSKETCAYLRAHALNVLPEERQLLNFVMQFENGSLFTVAKKLNNEQEASPLLDT
jgi:hypothetical protein